MTHVAESAVARAAIPENHEGCRSPVPAFALIGTGGAATYRMEAMLAMEALNTGVIRAGFEADLEPVRFSRQIVSGSHIPPGTRPEKPG